MTYVSTDAFRAQNNILFEAPIFDGVSHLQSRGGITNGEEQSWHQAPFDVIDVNHNGQTTYNYHITGFIAPLQSHFDLKQPALELSMDVLRQSAVRRNTDVITQDDAPNLRVDDTELVGRTFSGSVNHSNFRTLTQVAQQMDALGAKWAIDTAARKFYLYSPKGAPC